MQSLRKTGALVTVAQAPTATAIGAKTVARCHRGFFDEFDGPAVSITSRDVPVPVSGYPERACLPTPEHIVSAVRAAARREV